MERVCRLHCGSLSLFYLETALACKCFYLNSSGTGDSIQKSTSQVERAEGWGFFDLTRRLLTDILLYWNTVPSDPCLPLFRCLQLLEPYKFHLQLRIAFRGRELFYLKLQNVLPRSLLLPIQRIRNVTIAFQYPLQSMDSEDRKLLCMMQFQSLRCLALQLQKLRHYNMA